MSLLRSQVCFPRGTRSVVLPLSDEVLADLRAGDLVYLSGRMYTGRDQTHRRLCAMLDRGEDLPVDLSGQMLYYVGPSPARPGRVIGAAGPTTSSRMDAYTPQLLRHSLRATLGKGFRSRPVREAMLAYRAIYLATFGGAGALLAQCIREAEVVAFADAGPEAMFALTVENFPAVVINDLQGRDFYEESAARNS